MRLRRIRASELAHHLVRIVTTTTTIKRARIAHGADCIHARRGSPARERSGRGRTKRHAATHATRHMPHATRRTPRAARANQRGAPNSVRRARDRFGRSSHRAKKPVPTGQLRMRAATRRAVRRRIEAMTKDEGRPTNRSERPTRTEIRDRESAFFCHANSTESIDES
ncbi:MULTISPECIES: hypothetical protein [Burkholderia]|uniref:hypothetical protein n=1 Tax=Burkholderia TaxID=32008 RepID=UPI0011AE7ED1|nr:MULTISPECIES: hypothetical protein [Burkholderia]